MANLKFELCNAYCEVSHSETLALGNLTSRYLESALLPLTPDVLDAATVLQRHARGLRLRFKLTNSEYFRLVRKYGETDSTILATFEQVKQRQTQLINQYTGISEKTFNYGIVYESILADYLGITWRYNSSQLPFYLASDLETPTANIQAKLTNGSISETSIRNALLHAGY